MRTASERRDLRQRHINRRMNILRQSGFRGGLIFEKHQAKIENKGSGYMAKHGTMLHYANGNIYTQGKVRGRSSYSGTNNWSRRDIQQFDSMNSQMEEIYGKE